MWRELRGGRSHLRTVRDGLRHLYFIKSEFPDRINETMDFGLEVSQALLPDDGQEESFIEQYLGCLKEELPPQAFEKYGDRLNFYNGRFWTILPDPAVQQDYLSKSKYRFDRKLEKLNKLLMFG